MIGWWVANCACVLFDCSVWFEFSCVWVDLVCLLLVWFKLLLDSALDLLLMFGVTLLNAVWFVVFYLLLV